MTHIATHNEPHSFRPAKHGNRNRCTACGRWAEAPCHSYELWSDVDREREAARGLAEADELTATMRQPLACIDRAAGILERESPLFFGTGNSPALF